MDYTSAYWRIREWFPKLSEKAFHDLRMFHVELLRFNEKVNLISVKTVIDADLHHFADSICAASLIRPEIKGKVVYDIGSGNGFPGIVLSILNPDTQFIMIDSDLKKTEFLKYIIAQLKLTNATAEWKRIEDLKEPVIECAVSRAFAPLPRALNLTRKVFKKGGVYFHMKSTEWPIEVASLPPQLCSLWEVQFFKDYSLPIGDIKLSILKSTKLKE